ncbi:hypothetical protein BJ912DRAFT_954554 [Pholiota molesta]|nr:hypothetical protein BJ912DRAFT_954554 [Pholiota molesta]
MLSYTRCNCYIRRNSNPLLSRIFQTPPRRKRVKFLISTPKFYAQKMPSLPRQTTRLLKRKRNTFVPAVSLPPELLTMIFEFACCPSSDDETCMPNTDERCELCPGGSNLGICIGPGALTPLFIGTVCSAWRNIARSASQLCLVAHAHQLHTVDLFLPSSWKPALIRISRCLPQLTHLTLRVADSSPSLPRMDLFACAPQLREVTLVGYSVADVSLPWAQLERLDGEYFSAFECLETLRLCPRLRRCTLEQLYRGVFPIAPAPMTHAALEVLELLEPLIPRVLPLIARSACALETLHLVGMTPPEDELVECLRALPGLRELLLLNPETEKDVGFDEPDKYEGWRLEGMEMAEDQWCEEGVRAGPDVMTCEGCLVPVLEKLVYQGAVAFTPHALVGFLADRWWGTSPKGTEIVDVDCKPSYTEGPTKAGAEQRHQKRAPAKLQREGMHLEFLVDPNAD